MRAVTEHRSGSGISYRVRFRLDRSQTSETFATRAMAERFATLLDLLGPAGALRQIYAEDANDEIPTLDEYAARHIESLTRITEGTRTSYRRIYARCWSDTLGPLRLNQIDRHAISAVINAMVGEGKSDKTIANAHGLLAGIFNGAMVDELIGTSPSKGVKLPRNTEHETAEHRYLTIPEFAVLRANMAEPFRPLLDVLIGAGIRWGEAEALQVGSIDPNNGLIHITRAAKWNGSKSVREFGPPKTKRGRRKIEVPEHVIASVLPLMEGKVRSDLLLTMPRGGQMRHPTFHHRYWTPAIQAAGLFDPRLRIHDLRHSFASWQLGRNVPIYVVSARLGHESIQTTVDTYGHLLPDAQSQASAVMSDAFDAINQVSRTAIPPAPSQDETAGHSELDS